ncbi:MAG TPA: hypothetical protein VHG88_04725 [Burkholderiales bacterium]|nr:hypothetical protein [Burkholderiales bacterium]
MDARSIYERALARAAARVGGIEPLARRLGVPAARLTQWPPQQVQPDMAILLRLMEIVLDE